MKKMKFVFPNEKEVTVEAPDGLSALEIAHNNDIPLEGACGGNLACATCHVIVDEDWYDKLETPSEDEEDLLDLAFGLTSTSRLGCQIKMKDGLDGIKIKIPSKNRNRI